MQSVIKHSKASRAAVLGTATINAGAKLGLSADEVGKIIGRNRTSITRNGIAPDSTSGQLALLLVRLYRGLYALVGGNEQEMQHWIRSPIGTLQAAPKELIQEVTGLVHVVEYIDAMRGKV